MTKDEYVKKVQDDRGGHKAQKWVDLIEDVYDNAPLQFAMWMLGPKPIGWVHAVSILDQLSPDELVELMNYVSTGSHKFKDDIDLKVSNIIRDR